MDVVGNCVCIQLKIPLSFFLKGNLFGSVFLPWLNKYLCLLLKKRKILNFHVVFHVIKSSYLKQFRNTTKGP